MKRPEFVMGTITAILFGLVICYGDFSILSGGSEQPETEARYQFDSPYDRAENGLRVRSIQHAQIFDWLLAGNPEGQASGEDADAINPDDWRVLSIQMDKGDGTYAYIELARPLSWIEQQNAAVGEKVWMELSELGVSGWSDVLDINPAPELRERPSREHSLVTATFRHMSDDIINLQISGEPKVIGVTSNHPFWSVSRQQFISVGELYPGEQVLGLDGQEHRVISALPRPGPPEMVYNLEVYGEHVYRVGSSGLLVHNACPANGLSNLVEEESSNLGRWFARYADDGAETFSGRLLKYEDELQIAWTDNVRELVPNIVDIQKITGRNITTISGGASDGLESAIKSGRFNSDLYAKHLSRHLGGEWSVEVVKKHANAYGKWKIIATKLGG